MHFYHSVTGIQIPTVCWQYLFFLSLNISCLKNYQSLNLWSSSSFMIVFVCRITSQVYFCWYKSYSTLFWAKAFRLVLEEEFSMKKCFQSKFDKTQQSSWNHIWVEHLQWGSEYRTSPVFKWLKVVQSSKRFGIWMPFEYWSSFHMVVWILAYNLNTKHLNTGQVHYSDPHCIQLKCDLTFAMIKHKLK